MPTKKKRKAAKEGKNYVAEESYAVLFEELDFIAVNSPKESKDKFWIAQLSEDVTGLHEHHHLLKVTWLEEEIHEDDDIPGVFYVPGAPDSILAASIICRVGLKEEQPKENRSVFSLAPKDSNRISRKLKEQTAALRHMKQKDKPSMALMLDSETEEEEPPAHKRRKR